MCAEEEEEGKEEERPDWQEGDPVHVLGDSSIQGVAPGGQGK